MDRISGLSDELLLKILLLVPTRVAVSTSVLSKRWENLWMWLPKLEYGHTYYCPESECKRLQCFLNRNMSLHRAPVLESFRLQLSGSRFNPENINTWLVIAVSHRLRELEILYNACQGKQEILPSNLYTSRSLVVLKLVGAILMDVPRMVSLPCLKTLKLQRVKYFNDETLHRLLSNCPVLEDLVVKFGVTDILKRLTVVVPSLQSLSIDIKYAHSVNEFVIETPDLKYLKLGFHSYDEDWCLIANMPYLIEAHLDVDLHFLKRLLGSSRSAKGLIGSITSVKRLTICCSKTMLDEGFFFNRLEHLDLCLCTPLVPDQLFLLLKASSKLNRIDISLIDGHLSQGIDYWNQPTTVPECLLSSLQSLSWSKYTGKPHERNIVVYILKHAVHLKTATIKSSESDVPKLEMLKELALSSRASTACQLTFE